MKLAFSFFIFLLAIIQLPKLSSVRIDYVRAFQEEAVANHIYKKLEIVDVSNPELLGYKGATSTIIAGFSTSKKDKKHFFKNGVQAIEEAIAKEPKNVELRYLRLTVQTNAPRFLKYNKHIQSDKDVLLSGYDKISSKELKAVIKKFILQSSNFTQQEKVSIK